MKQTLTYILSFLFTLNGLAQVNLVPNGSFEELDSCPTFFYDFYLFKNWFNPNTATPDNYNECGLFAPCRVPSNANGFQYANEGVGYSGLALYVPSIANYREYVGIRLLSPLNPNQYYCLKFVVSLAEQYPLHISSIGTYFSSDSIFQNDSKVLVYPAQIENPDSNFIDDTTKWKPITGYFQAQGGEKFIYIGNFRNDTNTVIQGFTTGARSYVYLDNVQLYECDSLNGINENIQPNFKTYPNPTNGLFYIEKPTLQSAILVLYNLQGQLLQSIILPKGITKIEVDFSSYSNGLYLCRMLYENGRTESHKLVVQH